MHIRASQGLQPRADRAVIDTQSTRNERGSVVRFRSRLARGGGSVAVGPTPERRWQAKPGGSDWAGRGEVTHARG